MPHTAKRSHRRNTSKTPPSFPRQDRHASTENAGPAPANNQIESDLRTVQFLAHLFDSSISIPGTRFRIGLDSIIGLVPVVGDILAVGPFIYMLHIARRHRMPKRHMLRMAAIQGVDVLIGLMPVAGDVADACFKSHARNARILQRHLERRMDERFIDV